MANEMAKLEILLEAQTASFEKGMSQAINQIRKTNDAIKQQSGAMNQMNAQFKSVTDSAKTLSMALGAIGGVAFLKSLIDYADQMADLADGFGIAIGRVYGLTNALTEAGGKGDNFQAMMGKLSNAVDDAFEGADKARDMFKKLGITLDQIKNEGLDEIYSRIAKTLATIEDPAKRNAIAMEIFGKAAVGVDWEKHNRVLEETRKKYDDLSGSLQQAADYAEKFEIFAKQVGTAITATLGAIPNTLAKIGQGFKDMYEIAKGEKTLKDALDQTATSATAVVNPVTQVGRVAKQSASELALAAKELNEFNAALKRSVEEQLAWESKTLDSINPMREVDRELGRLQVALDSGRISWDQYADAMFKITEKVPSGLKESKKELDEISVAIGNTLSNSISGLVDVIFTAKSSFKDFAADFLSNLAKMILQLQIMKAMKASTFFGQFFAKGGAFAGNTGLPQGVYDRPTMFPMSGTGTRFFANGGVFGSRGTGVLGEAGPEAIMPLRKTQGGQLGVQASASPVNIEIINNAGVEVSAASTDNEDGTRNITVMIEKTMKGAFSSGSMDKLMRANYGLTRQAM